MPLIIIIRSCVMIEVKVFATLREGREKINQLSPEGISTAADVLRHFAIPEAEVAILLINGFHSKSGDPVKDGDVVALFPPVGGG